jgi:predicted transcriptional regulator
MTLRVLRLVTVFEQNNENAGMRLHDENASFRFNQAGLRKFLGDLECEIMELVWKKAAPTVTVREIFEVLRKERQIAYTTVMTTMVRLAEKGILKVVDKAGLANCYMPAENREQFLANAVGRVLEIFLKEFPKESASFMEKHSTANKRDRAKTSSSKKQND